MPNKELFRDFLTERLTAVCLEIFGVFERTVVDYQVELDRSNEENARLQRLLFTNTETKLNRAGDRQPSSSLPDLPRIKEEPALWASQEEEEHLSQLPLLHQTPTANDTANTAYQIEVHLDGDGYGVPPEPSGDSKPPSIFSPDRPATANRSEQVVVNVELLTDLKPGGKSKRKLYKEPEGFLSQVHSGNTDELNMLMGGLVELRNPFRGGVVLPATAGGSQLRSAVVPDGPTAPGWREEEESGGLLADDTEAGHSMMTSWPKTNVRKLKYQCPECGKQFRSKTNIADHINTHSGNTPHQCRECGKGFGSRGSLFNHMRTHTQVKPHQCPDCVKSFIQKCDLRKHMRTHTGERPYHCLECGKGFSCNGNLLTHMRTHTGEKPYSCQECDRRFSHKYNVVIHMRTHTGEKPYRCQECGESFANRATFKGHVKKHEHAKLVERLGHRL